MKPTRASRNARRSKLFAANKLDIRSRDHDKLIAQSLEMIDYSSDCKKEFEREGQLAFQHMLSHVDESRIPWASKVYDPVYASAQISRCARAAEAIYASPPVAAYDPGRGANPEAARKLTALSDHHDRVTRPRRDVLDGFGAVGNVGTAFWVSDWDYQERELTYWKRVPLEVDVPDPITGTVSKLWVPDGRTKLVRTREIVMDSPRIRPIHITAAFPDDRGRGIEGGEWFGFLEHLSDTQCRERVDNEDWNSEAVEMAIGGELPGNALKLVRNRLEWLEDIGLRTANLVNGLDLNKGNGRKTVEMIELWRRKKNRMERIIILNRAFIAWYGPSPYGHGRYPFLMAKNFSLDGMWWGLSNYRSAKWLIRAITSMLNAGLSEAEIATMPPLLIRNGTRVLNKRYEPRAEWQVDGPLDSLQFFQPSGISSRIAREQGEFLRGRMDVAIGSSDIGRGGMSQDAARSTATATTSLLEAAGIREKMHIDDFADEFIEPWYDMKALLMQQFNDYSVDLRISGDPTSPPINVYPEDFRGMEFAARAVASTSALKAVKQKQAMDLYNLANQYRDQSLDPRAVSELMMDVTFPEYKDQVMRSPEEVQAQLAAQGLPQMRGADGQVATQYQSPLGSGDTMQAAAQDLAAAYAR